MSIVEMNSVGFWRHMYHIAQTVLFSYLLFYDIPATFYIGFSLIVWLVTLRIVNMH